LFGDERVGLIGNLEAAFDAVVIGDRDEVHPALFEAAVERNGIGLAVRQAHATEEPLGRAVAEARVDVKVCFQWAREVAGAAGRGNCIASQRS
jgi:hypothetical protein